jgi:hypothetical protein
MASGRRGAPLSRKVSPSPAVGWAKIPPRSAVYGMRAIIATWTAIMSSLASAPKAAKLLRGALVHICSRFELIGITNVHMHMHLQNADD